MKKILIFGASGFFGKNIIDALPASQGDYECFAVFNNLKKFNENQHSQKVKWLQCDLFKKAEVEKLIRSVRPTHLIHLGWHVPPEQFWNAKENVNWLCASAQLFELFCEYGGQVFIGAGTLAEFDWEGGILEEESMILNPKTLYGQCKKSLHDLLVQIRNARQSHASIIWPRIGYFFGPDEPKEKLISKIIYHIREELPMDLALPNFSRPYAHVKYVGEVMAKVLSQDITKDLSFNLSGTVQYTLQDIVNFIQKKLNKKVAFVNYGAYTSKPLTLVVKNECLKNKIGFEIPDTFFSDLEVLIKHA